ncbi:tRNA (adenosine(37)-N6)-threonylcarbamoyltransferase complex ATPase subunit type 1 TsaE [Candidatus Electronema sp. JC]|uniref:tRNA (adenosine(37)-N6)-threonylcarbamoyltransferase complex ATPase subunit type 1 TsaE n=1 Tax=Candidatus Electronema sp. JC TaxID=3401570 RepID=UPI003AA971E9
MVGGGREVIHIALPDLAATAELGRRLGQLARSGDVILLHGGLGAGKTALTQAIAAGLGLPPEQHVSSPSFALLHEYSGGRLPIFHLDLWRLAGEDDVEAAGLLDYIGGPGLTVIEWPERLGSLRPAVRLDVFLEAVSETERMCKLEATGENWAGRLG